METKPIGKGENEEQPDLVSRACHDSHNDGLDECATWVLSIPRWQKSINLVLEKASASSVVNKLCTPSIIHLFEFRLEAND
jgi:hypothetical protein